MVSRFSLFCKWPWVIIKEVLYVIGVQPRWLFDLIIFSEKFSRFPFLTTSLLYILDVVHTKRDDDGF